MTCVEQMSAAAFAKGLLDLEGQLTPILVCVLSAGENILSVFLLDILEINKKERTLLRVLNFPFLGSHIHIKRGCPQIQ